MEHARNCFTLCECCRAYTVEETTSVCGHIEHLLWADLTTE